VDSEVRPEEIADGVYLVALQASNVYVWESDGLLSMVDTGVPGSADAILDAVEALGLAPEALAEILLTHFHRDHAGSAAELARRTRARVVAHSGDAAIVEGREQPPRPQLTELERPLAERLLGNIANLPGPQPEAVKVDRLVDDGETTAGGGKILAIPGHTRGSIAVLLPERGVLFTGDSIASTDSAPILGPFNLNTADAVASVRKQARLDFEIACVGDGRPIVGNAGRKVLAMIRSF
jgi:glyoxylase-like metal-dependent hydrolase (beta-lactamase superfamily II)